ncbi:hypothetical protein Gotur_019250 [Gossypium turneri]
MKVELQTEEAIEVPTYRSLPLELLVAGQLVYDLLYKLRTCSDFAQHPLSYFQSAIQLRTNLNSAMGLTRGSTYTVRQVAHTVFRLIGASPQISRSKHRRTNVLLLGELFICYGRPRPSHIFGRPQNCSNLFYGRCNSGSDTIEFP